MGLLCVWPSVLFWICPKHHTSSSRCMHRSNTLWVLRSNDIKPHTHTEFFYILLYVFISFIMLYFMNLQSTKSSHSSWKPAACVIITHSLTSVSWRTISVYKAAHHSHSSVYTAVICSVSALESFRNNNAWFQHGPPLLPPPSPPPLHACIAHCGFFVLDYIWGHDSLTYISKPLHVG